MSSGKKLNVGALPDQTEDYSHYEETEVLWGRVFFLGSIVFAAIAAVIYLVFGSAEEAPVVEFSETPVVLSIQETRPVEKSHELEPPPLLSLMPPEPEVVEEPAALEVSQEASVEIETQAAVLQARGSDLETEASSIELEETPEVESSIISPIYTANASILEADLRIGYDNGEQSDPLGYDVAMSDSGIIKVILGTKIEGLKGKTLYHEWYLNEERIARVKIPVKSSEQDSHSSKFINKQMLGAWKVKIVDGSKELYAEANFTVN